MTKQFSNYSDLLTFTRASKGHALRPVSYGSELVTNGGFDTDSDWTKSGVVISGGIASVTNGFRFLVQDAGLQTGKVYYISFDYTETSSNSLRVNTTGTNGAQQALLTSVSGTGSGTIQGAVVAEGPYIALEASQAAFTGTIDNVSVKEVTFDQPDGTLTLFEHPNNVPRVEWDADRNRLGLLVEEQRINLVTQSENFGASVWNVSAAGITVIADAIAAPDGTMTADKLQEASSTDNHRRGFAISGSNDKIFSFFAKAGERTKVRTWSFPGGNTQAATFDLSEGAVVDGSSAGKEAKIEDYGNDWYRCSVKVDGNQTAVVVGPMIDGISGASTATYTGDGSSGVYVWGAQIEDNVSFPTSYIKSNSGSTTTRSADVASIPVADFGYNQSAGTVTVEVDSLMTTLVGNPMAYNFNNGTSQERLTVFASQGTWRFVATDGNTQQSSLLVGTFGEAKIASSFEQNKFNHCVNATLGTEDTSGTMPTITELGIGSQLGGNQLNGHIKSIQYYPRRLTNAQLVDLTS